MSNVRLLWLTVAVSMSLSPGQLVKVRLLNIEWCRVINEDVSVSIHYPE